MSPKGPLLSIKCYQFHTVQDRTLLMYYFPPNTLGSLAPQRLPWGPSSLVPSHCPHHSHICLNVTASRITEAWCDAPIQKFALKELRVCKDEWDKWYGRTKEKQGGHLPCWNPGSCSFWRRKELLFDGWHGLPCSQRTEGKGMKGPGGNCLCGEGWGRWDRQAFLRVGQTKSWCQREKGDSPFQMD